MRVKAVLFDLDGTLVDSNDHHVLAWDAALRAEGFAFTRAQIHDQIGKGSDMFVPALLPDVDEDTAKRLADAHGEIFQGEYRDRVQPFPGARDLIAAVKARGQKVVLASSASAGDLDHYLDLLNARDLIDETTSAGDVERTKPAPDIFVAVLEKIAPITAGEAIMIGDTPYDVEAAAKCGVATIGLRSGKFPEESLRSAGAIAIYDDVAALLADYDGSPLAF
jgi:membrane protein